MTDTKWDKLANDASMKTAVEALKENGMSGHVVGSKEEARNLALSMIPKDAEIMKMTSVTLDQTGISEEVEKLDNSARKKFSKMDRDAQKRDMRKIGAAPEYTIGSVHALTEDGKLLIASNTGSQLPAYAYGADKVIFVVGSQKIVKNLDEGMKRLYEHTLPLENERAKKAYGVGSNVSKLLVINKELSPDRVHVIIVKDVLGF